MKNITVVIPVFNEGRTIAANLAAIRSELARIEGVSFRILVVNDGSTDNTIEQVRVGIPEDGSTSILCLNRNFGKEAAILAGLQRADGDAAVVMDCDLQHPPALERQMVALWQNGVDVVEACKSRRGRESVASKILSTGFYRLFNAFAGMEITDQSDFKLLDRTVVEAYCAMRERRRFFRGMIAWMGFPSARVYFDVPERAGGESGWSKAKLLRLSLDAITGFSSSPLYIITLLGGVCLVISLVLAIQVFYRKLTGSAATGFSTVILLILLIGSFIMIGLGLIGVYVAQIFHEVKQRPTYLIHEPRENAKRSPPA